MQELTEKMLSYALIAMANAYAPYSKFHVGSCILAENGKLYSGCNVENASYPVGQCAEASAIGKMVTDGQYKIKAIVIVNSSQRISPPCGACRQKIREFATPDTIIYLAKQDFIEKITTLAELLPNSFGPDNLESI